MDKRPDYAFNIKAFLTYHFLSIVDVSVDSIAIKYITKCCFVASGNKLTYSRTTDSVLLLSFRVDLAAGSKHVYTFAYGTYS